MKALKLLTLITVLILSSLNVYAGHFGGYDPYYSGFGYNNRYVGAPALRLDGFNNFNFNSFDSSRSFKDKLVEDLTSKNSFSDLRSSNSGFNRFSSNREKFNYNELIDQADFFSLGDCGGTETGYVDTIVHTSSDGDTTRIIQKVCGNQPRIIRKGNKVSSNFISRSSDFRDNSFGRDSRNFRDIQENNLKRNANKDRSDKSDNTVLNINGRLGRGTRILF